MRSGIWYLLALVVLFTFSPVIIPVLALVFGLDVGDHSPIGVLPWLLLYTLPIGFGAFVCWLAVVLLLWMLKD